MENQSQQPTDKKGELKTAGRQFLRFVAVGIINTAVDFLIFNVEMKITGITSGSGIFVLNIISFTVATANSYFLNKLWTFKSQNKSNQAVQLSQFLTVSVIGVAINSGVVSLITTYLSPFLGIGMITTLLAGKNMNQLWANFAKLVATGISLIWNFVGYKFWVFKK